MANHATPAPDAQHPANDVFQAVPRPPLTTHALPSDDPFSPVALCGATSLTTSTGSMRMTASVAVVDCAVCRDLLDGEA